MTSEAAADIVVDAPWRAVKRQSGELTPDETGRLPTRLRLRPA